MNNAELIVEILRRAGVTHGFGIPSGNVLPLLEALRAGGMEFVLTAHEGSAGFAADVTGRITGRPGLCIATHGPGATNLATGVGCAYLDRSPMIAITCTVNADQIGRRIQMYIDHQTLFRPISKATFLLKHGSVAETVSEALRIAMAEPQGPVHLELPEDVALALTTEEARFDFERPPLPLATDENILRAVDLLRSARRPVAVVGASAMRMREPETLRRFVESYGIPFATTTMAKGLIDDGHPLGLGCIERARRQTQRAYLNSADLIVGVGYDTIEVEYEVWVGGVPILHLDIEPADTDGQVLVEHTVAGDLDYTLDRLCAAAPGGNAWPIEEISRHREKFQRSLRPDLPGFGPHQAIDVVRDMLPREGVLAFDVGAHTHQIASQWSAPEPKTFLITNGWSSMGFGLPAAIAAKIARPDLPVVCILGDACFQMTCGELAVARRLGLALPIVILNDGWLSLIRIKQQKRQLQVYGTEASATLSRHQSAHYFGVPSIEVRTPEQLEQALGAALAASEPTVIDAMIDPTGYGETVYD